MVVTLKIERVASDLITNPNTINNHYKYLKSFKNAQCHHKLHGVFLIFGAGRKTQKMEMQSKLFICFDSILVLMDAYLCDILISNKSNV